MRFPTLPIILLAITIAGCGKEPELSIYVSSKSLVPASLVARTDENCDGDYVFQVVVENQSDVSVSLVPTYITRPELTIGTSSLSQDPIPANGQTTVSTPVKLNNACQAGNLDMSYTAIDSGGRKSKPVRRDVDVPALPAQFVSTVPAGDILVGSDNEFEYTVTLACCGAGNVRVQYLEPSSRFINQPQPTPMGQQLVCAGSPVALPVPIGSEVIAAKGVLANSVEEGKMVIRASKGALKCDHSRTIKKFNE